VIQDDFVRSRLGNSVEYNFRLSSGGILRF
jgi:hypothetical protein